MSFATALGDVPTVTPPPIAPAAQTMQALDIPDAALVSTQRARRPV
ncbi:MAG: hypothetical protein ACOY5V_13070 [Pseudomonadota bacterium]